MTLTSAIYVGRVRHRRRTPRHEFEFPLFMMYLDLDELSRVLGLSRLLGAGRWHPARFCRRDYLGDPAIPLADAVRDLVERDTGSRPLGSIRMLTHLRYFGHIFNPVTFYYCFDNDDQLQSIVAEITNTPWKERHAYVLQAGNALGSSARVLRWRFGKEFYVSPFFPLDQEYDWSFTPPAEALLVHMNVRDHRDGEPKVFDATLRLSRRDLTPASLRLVLLRYPAMTIQVIASIYWHALRLRLKRATSYPHVAGPVVQSNPASLPSSVIHEPL